jgi:hypothetical protein
MFRRDPVRTQKIRIAVRYLLERDRLEHGTQARLAQHFRLSRQRVHQIVVEERARAMARRPAAPALADSLDAVAEARGAL